MRCSAVMMMANCYALTSLTALNLPQPPSTSLSLSLMQW